MKKIVPVIIVVAVLLFVLPMILGKSKKESGEPTTPAASVSPEMSAWLDSLCPNLEFDTYPKQIREVTVMLTKLATAHHQFPLKIELDPRVQGTVTGRWINIPHRDFLDDVCARSGWKWEVVGPATIRISVRE